MNRSSALHPYSSAEAIGTIIQKGCVGAVMNNHAGARDGCRTEVCALGEVTGNSENESAVVYDGAA